MSNTITISGINRPELQIHQELKKYRDLLLIEGKEVFRVSNTEEQAKAFSVAQKQKKFLTDVEALRKDLKKPVIDFGKFIDQNVHDFVDMVEGDLSRVTLLLTTWQVEEQRKANIIRQEEERKRKEIMAKALKEEEELEKRIALSNSEMAKEKLEIELEQRKEQFRENIIASHEAVAVAVPVKEKGMSISKDFDFEVISIHELYNANPAFVRMEENRVVIKSMIRQGMRECPGLKIYEVESKMTIRRA